MSEKYISEFKDIDFLTMLVREFLNRKIIEFNKFELERALYCYKTNPKYAPLFLNIKEVGNMVLLGDAINALEKIGGLVSLSKDNMEYGITDRVLPLKTYDEVEALLLVKELAKEYALRRQVVETTHGNIKIYGINPNGFYSLVSGYHKDKYIEWNLITDGEIKKVCTNDIDRILWDNPADDKIQISVVDGKYGEVEVNNASFVIMNGIVDDEVKTSILASDSLKEKEIREQLKYKTLRKVPKNSFIKILSLER